MVPMIGQSPCVRLRRDGATVGADGRAVVGVRVSLAFSASVQPAEGQVLEQLPEGERSGTFIQLWAPLELALRTASGAAGTAPADLVTWQGQTYEVRAVKTWTTLLPHCWALAALVDSP
jgi:hypothetical protein